MYATYKLDGTNAYGCCVTEKWLNGWVDENSSRTNIDSSSSFVRTYVCVTVNMCVRASVTPELTTLK